MRRILTCAGCLDVHSSESITEYRRKMWCGSESCREIIDTKIKHKNYLRKQKKIKNGTWRNGVEQEQRAAILDRDDNRCHRCRKQSLDYGEMQVHHIVPVAEGGADENENLITLCKLCHTKVHQIGWEEYVEPFTKTAKVLEQNYKA